MGLVGTACVILELATILAYQYRTIGPGSPPMRRHRLWKRDQTDLRSAYRNNR